MEDLATISTIVANALVIFSYSYKYFQRFIKSKRALVAEKKEEEETLPPSFLFTIFYNILFSKFYDAFQEI